MHAWMVMGAFAWQLETFGSYKVRFPSLQHIKQSILSFDPRTDTTWWKRSANVVKRNLKL